MFEGATAFNQDLSAWDIFGGHLKLVSKEGSFKL
jgi:hypothetical protein